MCVDSPRSRGCRHQRGQRVFFVPRPPLCRRFVENRSVCVSSRNSLDTESRGRDRALENGETVNERGREKERMRERGKRNGDLTESGSARGDRETARRKRKEGRRERGKKKRRKHFRYFIGARVSPSWAAWPLDELLELSHFTSAIACFFLTSGAPTARPNEETS